MEARALAKVLRVQVPGEECRRRVRNAGVCAPVACGCDTPSSPSPTENQSTALKSRVERAARPREACLGKQASGQAWKNTRRFGPGARLLGSDL